jgi:hypothetical protein
MRRPALKPAVPPGLLAKTQQSWEEFWQSPLARMVVPTDLPALERLFRLRDRRERFDRHCTRHPMLEDAPGRFVANPLLREISSIDVQLCQLEDRFLLNPTARRPAADRPVAGRVLSLADHLKGMSLSDVADELER